MFGTTKFKFYSLFFLFSSIYCFAQPDHSNTKTLYLVSNAHFDTQWRWTVETSINKYIPNTLKQNFYLIKKYPFYNFNFEGAIKYMWMKEYYPQYFDTLKTYISQNRWNICGSSLDAGDVNIPSPEAIIRNILLGQSFYKQEFSKTSCDIFLPDCFGFGYALPGIANHCGLKGFSTQKLTWGSAYGIPFNLGIWEGVDGSKIFAALDPGDYTRKLKEDYSYHQKSLERIDSLGAKSNLFADYLYYGTGDRGGSPEETSIQWLGKSIMGTGPLKVIAAPADLLCRQITPEQKTKLPQYKGELITSFHGTGCYTSQSVMKR